ncbi:hypothetical protein ASE88_08785 [Sphingomonas sp. Leaf38]|nr:hypothetical protein ASE88_08785 [Sphingomonas sp. Leaf38]
MLWIALAATAAIAGPPGLPAYGVDAPRINVLDQVIYAPTGETVAADSGHRARLIALRQEGLAQQAEDGGTLTPAHRDELQRKLERIQLRFAELRRRADAYAVDGNGHARYSAATRPGVVLPPSLRLTSASKSARLF